MVKVEKRKLSAGLYFVATPIGTARDITLHALDILTSADIIAAEDTRSMRKLLDIHGIALGGRPVVSYHDHSSEKSRNALIENVKNGQSVAYASEAGTPLIADPGYHLVQDAYDADVPLYSAPGPSAIIVALTLAGMPTDRFLFEGFLPNSQNQRRTQLQELSDIPATLVFYESPKRVAAMLKDAAEVLGAERHGAVCRELTKKFEQVRRGSLQDLAEQAVNDPPRGEIVVIIDRNRSDKNKDLDLDSEIRKALTHMSVKDTADAVAKAFGLKKRDVYQRVLQIGQNRTG